MLQWNLVSLLAVALLCTGCKGPGVLRNFSITKASDSASSNDETPPPMRLASDAVSTKSRWTNPPGGNANAGSYDTGSKTTSTKGDRSNVTKPSGLAAPTQLADLPPAPSTTPVATKEGTEPDPEQLLGAFQDASPEVRELATRYAAAVNLRNRKDEAETALKTPTETPAAAKNVKQESAVQQASGAVAKASEPQAAVAYLSDDESSPAPSSSVVPASSVSKSTEVKPPAELTPPVEAKPMSKGIEEASTEALLKELMARMSVEQGESTDDKVRSAMRQRVMALLQQNVDDATKPIESLSPTEQQFVKNQMQALALLLDEHGTPQRSRRYGAALTHLQEAVSSLAAATGTLEVRQPTFCTEVESYGCITRFDKDRFKPGQQVILYCEVDRFVAEKVNNRFQTHLQGAYEIFDAAGTKVGEQTLPEDEQWCDHYRRDYFIAYRFYLPTHLTNGNYRLKLTMEDRKGKLYGQSEVPFEIAAQ